MKFVLLLTATLQITSVNGFFGWWRSKMAESNQTNTTAVENIADFSIKGQRFQAENFGINLKVGDTYTFRIFENPSTGYKWNYSEADLSEVFTVTYTYIQKIDPYPCKGCKGVGGFA